MFGLKVDFAIIGFQKCGTTSIHNYLAEIPDIFMPKEKEMYFFTRNIPSIRNEEYVSAFFKGAEARKYVGFSDVDLVCDSNGLRELKDASPDVKLIVCVRDPVNRAFSAWSYESQKMLEKEKSFLQALHKDNESNNFGYISRGMYHKHTKELLKIFSLENVLFVSQENMNKNIHMEMNRILHFLKINASFDASDVKRFNETGAPRFKLFQQLLWDQNNVFHKLGSMLPMGLKRFLKTYVKRILVKLNTKKGTKKIITDSEYNTASHYFDADFGRFCKDFDIDH